MIQSAKRLARTILPRQIYQPLAAHARSLRWMRLRRVTPVSRTFGYDLGQPIDRYYIERFLRARQADIRGHVLEIGDPRYTQQFGGDRVSRSDVLHFWPGNPYATIVADLTNAPDLPSDTFDCIVLTQVLQFITDAPAAIKTLHRILKGNGVLLATFPGISQISRSDANQWGDYWRFTGMSAHRLFSAVFSDANMHVEIYGNVLTASALLYGLPWQALVQAELDYRDEDYEVIICVRAVKFG